MYRSGQTTMKVDKDARRWTYMTYLILGKQALAQVSGFYVSRKSNANGGCFFYFGYFHVVIFNNVLVTCQLQQLGQFLGSTKIETKLFTTFLVSVHEM